MKAVSFAAALVAVVATTASADPAGAAEAEALFRQAKQLLADGKVAEACAAFDAAAKADATVGTLLNQAACRERNHQLATAWGLFVDAEHQTHGDSAGEAQQYNKAAVSHAAKLEPRLSKLTIAVGDDAAAVAELSIARDGNPVDRAAWNQPIPVDGGTYTVVAHAPGRKDWSTTVAVKEEQDAEAVTVPVLEPAPAVPPPPPTPPPPPAPPAAMTTVEAHEPGPWPYVVGGASVVAFVGALVLEHSAVQTENSAENAMVPTTQLSLWHDANERRYAATAIGAASIAGVGVAVWMYLHDHRRPTETRVSWLPGITEHGAGVVLGGTLP